MGAEYSPQNPRVDASGRSQAPVYPHWAQQRVRSEGPTTNPCGNPADVSRPSRLASLSGRPAAGVPSPAITNYLT
jgi:hypothetical protein